MKKPTKVKPVQSAKRDPQELLARLAHQLARTPRRGIELHARLAVAFGETLDPQEDLGPDRLRAGVAAPEASRERREEEQRQRGQHQQPGQEDEVLRPHDQPEDMELARGQVEQHRLAAMQVEPRQHIEEPEQQPHRQYAQSRKASVNLTRIDLLVCLVVGTAAGIDHCAASGAHESAPGSRAGPSPALICRCTYSASALASAPRHHSPKNPSVYTPRRSM